MAVFIWVIGAWISFGMFMKKHEHCRHTMLHDLFAFLGHFATWPILIGQSLYRPDVGGFGTSIKFHEVSMNEILEKTKDFDEDLKDSNDEVTRH